MTPRRVSLAVLLAVAAVVMARTESSAAEWKPLFNGKDLTGWKAVGGPAESWRVVDGLLSCNGKGGGWLATDDEYSNFEIELEYRISAGGNSGVFLRTPLEGDPAFTGMEVQILDDHNPKYANIKEWQHCGSLYGIVAAPPLVAKKAGEWQKMHIVCNGKRVKVTLNGMELVDADLTAHPDKEAEHPGIKRTTGRIGLQNHSTEVDFRNVRIREL